VPGEPQTIWSFAGAFCAIKDCIRWSPTAGRRSTLTLKDGGKIKEKLIEKDDTSYSYEIVEARAQRSIGRPSSTPTVRAVAGMKGIKQMALQKTPVPQTTIRGNGRPPSRCYSNTPGEATHGN
jgi:hypothetical protein